MMATIRRGNLRMAISDAIAYERDRYPNNFKLQTDNGRIKDSAFVAGLLDLQEALERGERIEVIY